MNTSFKYIFHSIFLFAFLSLNADAQKVMSFTMDGKTGTSIKTGADQTEKYIPLLIGKSVAIVANQTSVIKKTNLVDSLLRLKINVKKIFFPEHGFRGDEDAGATIKTYKDKL